MSDFYTEQLIKKQTTGKDRMIKILLILLTVVSVLIIFIFPFGIILPVALIALDVFISVSYPHLDVYKRQGLAPPDLIEQLMTLELQGYIKEVSRNQYIKVR